MDRIITTNNWTWSFQVVPGRSFDYQEKINKLKKKILIVGYEADLENSEKILPPAPQKPRNQNQLR